MGKVEDKMGAPDNQLLLSFYGDDFTGSTDAMEALALNGIKTVLFLEPPTPEQLTDRFPDLQAFGVAGVSRAMAPQQMERELKPILESLRAIPTPIVHYKICSTFDSSPSVGSIGYAMDMASELFPEQSYIPLLVGVPILKRYTVFGHHFATVEQHSYRLDRHPTMSRHPVTPMDEADLRIHLAKQTNKSMALMDILDLAGERHAIKEKLKKRTASKPDVLLFDVLDEERLLYAGELIWEEACTRKNRFVVGSSGVEYALAVNWKKSGVAEDQSDMQVPLGAVERMLVVSGSCSPVTELQIKHALHNGFIGVPVDVERLIDPLQADQVRSELLLRASDIFQQNKNPLFYTAMGAEDDQMQAAQQKLSAAGLTTSVIGRLIGEQLGRLTKDVITAHKLKRFVAAGGDTSGFVTRELGIYAIENLMSIAPGGPLCRGYSDDPRFDGIELALKGGQVGRADYFVRVLEGK